MKDIYSLLPILDQRFAKKGQLPENIDARLNILSEDTATLDGIAVGASELVRNTDTKRIEIGNQNGDGGRYDPMELTTNFPFTMVIGAAGAATFHTFDIIPNAWKLDSLTTYGLIIGTVVAEIEAEAFSGCTNITGALRIPSSVYFIGDSAFNGSSFTGPLILPPFITEISAGTFQSCSGFTGSLVIPNLVTGIFASAFENCSGFTGALTIPISVVAVGDAAFYNCGFSSANLYCLATAIDSNSFAGSNITTIHARADDITWTAGAGQTIGGKTGITVIKDLV